MNDHWAIDGIEAAWARLERNDGATVVVPRDWLPAAAREGEVLRLERPHPGTGEAAHLRFLRDAEATRRRDEAAREALRDLPRAPAGDLEL